VAPHGRSATPTPVVGGVPDGHFSSVAIYLCGHVFDRGVRFYGHSKKIMLATHDSMSTTKNMYLWRLTGRYNSRKGTERPERNMRFTFISFRECFAASLQHSAAIHAILHEEDCELFVRNRNVTAQSSAE